MTRAFRLTTSLLFLLPLTAGCDTKNEDESIVDPWECISNSERVYNFLIPFDRTEGGRFECHSDDYIGQCVIRKCGSGEENPVIWRQVCAMVDGKEYVTSISECYPSHVPVYPCEGHENQYGDCINDDVCAYCGNGIKDKCELCEGELGVTMPCELLDTTFTGGMVTRCNATCDDYDFSDCTTD